MGIARNIARLIPNGSGQLPTANLQDAAITTAKIANGAVVEADLADSAVTNAKIASMAASKLSGVIPDANAPSGSVIQVVQATKTNTQSFSGLNTSWADISGLSVSITPLSSSSKILILGHIMVSATGNPPQIRIVRDSTPILVGDAAGSRKQALVQPWGGGSNVEAFPVSPVFMDSPNTTSSVTYKFQLSIGGGATNHINRADRDQDASAEDARGASSILVLEIAP